MVTVTDGDGDVATATIDVGEAISFEDDEPIAILTLAPGAAITVDETAGLPGETAALPSPATRMTTRSSIARK